MRLAMGMAEGLGGNQGVGKGRLAGGTNADPCVVSHLTGTSARRAQLPIPRRPLRGGSLAGN